MDFWLAFKRFGPKYSWSYLVRFRKDRNLSETHRDGFREKGPPSANDGRRIAVLSKELQLRSEYCVF